jgi:DNA-binding transcriptional MerR regulator
MDATKTFRHFTGNAVELAQAAIDCATELGLDIDAEKTNERLVRYYQTEGVLDRPDRHGRDSTYHFRHLVQVLNARRMVANGLSLSLAIEYNSTRSTDELAASLTKPLPNAAELLISKFKDKDLGGTNTPRAKQPSPRPPMAVVDVLDEVKAVKNELLSEIKTLMQVKDEVYRLRDVLIHNQKIGEKGDYKMEQLLERLHETSREFEHMFKEAMHRQRDIEDRFFHENRQLLQKVADGQIFLMERIEAIEKKLSSL